jgi:hypothetical protein
MSLITQHIITFSVFVFGTSSLALQMVAYGVEIFNLFFCPRIQRYIILAIEGVFK